MADEQALRPDFSMRSFINKERVEDVKTLTHEEKVLAAGGQDAFWKILKAHFENAIEQLEQLNDNAIAGGATREQIGENAIVISQVKGVLRKVINVVEDSKEATLERGAGQQ